MKVTEKATPSTYTIELSQDEARKLYSVLTYRALFGERYTMLFNSDRANLSTAFKVAGIVAMPRSDYID